MGTSSQWCGGARVTGLSLVEILVTLLVGLILLGGISVIYIGSQQSHNAVEQLARMQESGRFAMHLIAQDLRRSGFWGGNADLTTNGGVPGPVNPAHACDNDNAWGRMIAWRVSGRNNGNAGYDCAEDFLANSDILTIRYADPDEVIAFDDYDDIPNNGRLYLRSTMLLGWVLTGTQRASPANEPQPGLVGAPEHLLPVARPLVSNAYYVADSGRTCASGDVIPALNRVTLNPVTGLPVVEEVASGVEQFQVRYLLGDRYVDANEVPDADWRDVAAVRVWLLVRSECPEPDFVNNTTYAMGDLVIPDAPDAFRRLLHVSTVMLRNTAVR